MIREARKEDKQDVYALWKLAYPSHSRNYLNFYFKNHFDKGTCILIELDNRIISSLQMNEHIMRIFGKKVNISYILGVSTLPDYRRRGHMKTLMESAIDEASHNHMVTLIKAFNPKLYEQFGFETLYYHKFYTIPKDQLQNVSTTHISYTADAEELVKVYQQFVSHFDGYYIRNIEYYSSLLNEMVINQKQMVVYRNRRGEVSGYLIYQFKKEGVHVEEAVYLESVVLTRMLKAALGKADEITVEVSNSEKLEKIFPMIIAKRQPAMMVRVNNLALFNNLYNTNAKNSKEAFSIMKKPLWCHEYY